MIVVGPFQLNSSVLFYSILFYSILFYSILFYSFYSIDKQASHAALEDWTPVVKSEGCKHSSPRMWSE